MFRGGAQVRELLVPPYRARRVLDRIASVYRWLSDSVVLE